MGNFVFNIALGTVQSYANNVKNNTPANSALICIPLETTGLEGDTAMRQRKTLTAVLAASTNEQTTAGRKTVTDPNVTITVDDANNLVNVKVPDQTWTGVPAGNQVAAFLWCYDPDTTVADDTTVIPLTKHDRLWTPDGTTFTLSGPNGFYQAAPSAS